jgi:hypothetical protein
MAPYTKSEEVSTAAMARKIFNELCFQDRGFEGVHDDQSEKAYSILERELPPLPDEGEQTPRDVVSFFDKFGLAKTCPRPMLQIVPS